MFILSKPFGSTPSVSHGKQLSATVSALGHLAQRAVRLLVRSLERPRRTVQVSALAWRDVADRLADHGIRTRVEHDQLVAFPRSGRVQSDLFLIEFAEFMATADSAFQAQWLEFCLALEAA